MRCVPRRRTRPAHRATAALAVGLALLCGCGAVQVEPPSPGPEAAERCAALVARLPDSLYDEDRVPVQPDSDLVAAWGSPAITLRCGVERPAALQPASHLVVVNDIAWLGEPEDAPVQYTAVGREAYVELALPPEYTPPALGLVTVSELIEAEIPALPAGEL